MVYVSVEDSFGVVENENVSHDYFDGVEDGVLQLVLRRDAVKETTVNAIMILSGEIEPFISNLTDFPFDQGAVPCRQYYSHIL